MKDIFHLKENYTTVKKELLAGLTTFMTMAYIVALNPNILTNFGADGGAELWNGIFLATCISAAIGTMMMAFFANKPFVMASGIGVNSFFALVVTNIAAITGTSYLASFQSALCLIFIEGALFIVLTLLNVREKIVNGLPLCIRLSITPAIGMMLLNIGFGSNAGIYSENGGPYFIMRDFFGSLTANLARDTLGSGYGKMVLYVVTVFAGLFIIAALAYRKKTGAVLLGMLGASAIYWAGGALFLQMNPFESLKNASFLPDFSAMANTTLFKLNFSGLADVGFFTMITLVITFCIIDMFDTIGTLVGTATRAGMVDENGNMPRMKQALMADAVGTMSGALLGTSTVTTFLESAAGVEAGGRTGLTSLTSALLFLSCIFIAPLANLIPAAATSAALIYVGFLMLGGLKAINFNDITEGLPAAVMLLAIPISGSIGHGIGLGIISYSAIKLLTGKGREVPAVTYVMAAIFLVKFFFVV